MLHVGRAVAQFSLQKCLLDLMQKTTHYTQKLARGVTDFGANVLDIGMAGTEENVLGSYSFQLVRHSNYCFHNPINYNGIKIVKADKTIASAKISID